MDEVAEQEWPIHSQLAAANDCLSAYGPAFSPFKKMIRTKPKKESSLTAVLAGAIAATLVGISLGVAHEVRHPPEFVRTPSALKAEREKNPREPIFLIGGTHSSLGWQQIIEAVTQSGTGNASVELTTGDLNEIASQYLNFTLGKQQAKDQGEEPSYAILPDTPNFALYDGQLQISVPFEILIFGAKRSAHLVTTGSFVDEKTFVIDSAWLNSARVPEPMANLLLKNLYLVIKK